jgi:hypothetical protein
MALATTAVNETKKWVIAPDGWFSEFGLGIQPYSAA